MLFFNIIFVFYGILFVRAQDGVCNPEGKNGCTDVCGVTGNWTNELGSRLELTCQADKSPSSVGTLTGKYNSAVGAASEYYTLTGRYTMVGSDCILGFSVAWNNDAHGNSKSTTSWTGVHYANSSNISTFWILTSYTSPGDMWKNSNVGQNIFTKNQ